MDDRVPSPVALPALLQRVGPLAVLGEPAGVLVTSVDFDHREVRPGSLFCCLPGERTDGHAFAEAARRAGAVALLCERSLGPAAGGAVQLVVGPGGARAAMAQAACAFYGDPAERLRSVGVTGTNGKTTTTFLLRSIFARNGWQTAVVGTLGGARTTPEAPVLQGLLAGELAGGATACAVEVTSHALVQHRVDGIRFEVGVFTNLSQDHLDYHKTMEAYFEAKATLLTPGHARLGVVCADDPYGRRLLERPAIETVSFSLDDAKDLEVGLAASSFRLGGRLVRLPAGGLFNVRNALGAAAAARSLGVGVDAIVAGLESSPSVPGRFEALETLDGLTVIVDFAHTPASLEEVLQAARRGVTGEARPQAAARVLLVFGAGGDRDRGKRPLMGAVAGEWADLVVVTSDNPRSEDPAAIAGEVVAGMARPGDCRVELDRRAAIGWALGEARPGDVVVVAGKGHERTQQFADRTEPFDDRRVVVEELGRLGRPLRSSGPELQGRSA